MLKASSTLQWSHAGSSGVAVWPDIPKVFFFELPAPEGTGQTRGELDDEGCVSSLKVWLGKGTTIGSHGEHFVSLMRSPDPLWVLLWKKTTSKKYLY